MSSEESSENSPTSMATQKEGLQALIDFSKTLLALAGGSIAFIVQPLIGPSPIWLGSLSIIALLFLAVSVVSGLFVFSGATVKLGHKDHDLEDRYIKIPGLTQLICLMLGFCFLSVIIIVKIFSHIG